MNYIKQIQELIENTLKNKLTNFELIQLYYQIGKILKETKDKNLMELEMELKKEYGIIIGFSRRNFINMMHFYEFYKNDNLITLGKIFWKNHLVILNQKNKDLIPICIDYSLNIEELEHYIKTKEVKKINSNLNSNDSLLELVSLQKNE